MKPPIPKNPLGIVSLFLAFVEVIVGAIAMWTDKITNGQLWLILCFIVFFPFIVWICFLWLVVKHHKKLYAPKDFDSSKEFIEMWKPSNEYEPILEWA